MNRIVMRSTKIVIAHLQTVVTQADNHEAGTRMSHEVRLRALAIDAISVAQVVVDANDTIVLANEQVRARFGLSARELGRPLRDVELCYRPVELRPLLERALAERQPVGVANVERSGPDGQTRYYDVLDTPLLDDGALPLRVAITFTGGAR